jgi:hypothetical protein
MRELSAVSTKFELAGITMSDSFVWLHKLSVLIPRSLVSLAPNEGNEFRTGFRPFWRDESCLRR